MTYLVHTHTLAGGDGHLVVLPRTSDSGDGGSPRESPGCNASMTGRAVARALTVAGWAAAVLPARTATRPTLVDRAVIRAVRFYQAHLTHLTPPCAQGPSCSSFAVWAVGRYGWQVGLQVVAARVQGCTGATR